MSPQITVKYFNCFPILFNAVIHCFSIDDDFCSRKQYCISDYIDFLSINDYYQPLFTEILL